MKLATRKIIILVVLNLMITNFCLAQASESVVPETTRTFTISGSVGLGGVTMTGLPGNPVSGSNGFYKAIVSYGWSGIVKPVKDGYTFEPSSLPYHQVRRDCVDNNYVPKLITFIISGTTGVSGVVMRGLPGNPVSDENGFYEAAVPFGWTGTVGPSKEGFVFVPEGIPYLSVFEDQPQQDYRPRRVRSASMAGFAGGREVLVVPNADVNPEELNAIIQDLQVMSQILNEKFRQPQTPPGMSMFADFGDFFGRESRDTEATYLQGYGVLFLMEVNFAISPTTPMSQEREEGEDVDPVWQNARRKIFSPGSTVDAAPGFADKKSGLVEMEQLKKNLIETLKHAANIRYLKPDEQVIVTVIGRSSVQGRRIGYGIIGGDVPSMDEDVLVSESASESSSSNRGGSYGSYTASNSYGAAGRGIDRGMGGGGYGGGMSMRGGMGGGMSMRGGMGRGGMGGYGIGGMGGSMSRYGEVSFSSPIVLTIRAKKSDVDLFAAKELNLELFRQRVQIFTY